MRQAETRQEHARKSEATRGHACAHLDAVPGVAREALERVGEAGEEGGLRSGGGPAHGPALPRHVAVRLVQHQPPAPRQHKRWQPTLSHLCTCQKRKTTSAQ